MTNTTPTPDMVRNILDVFESIDLADVAEGAEWYAEARAFAADLAAETGYTVEQVSGVIAATSPMMSWDLNKALAARVVRAGGLSSGYLGAGLRKCDAILAGADIESTLKGLKIVNFFRSIVSAGASGVCIDRHAIDIAFGVRHKDSERPSLGARAYAAISAAYVAAAEQINAEGLDVTPAEVQSVTWTAWRAIYGGTRA